MESSKNTGNTGRNTSVTGGSTKKKRKLKRMISSSDSDDDVVEVETPTKSNPADESKPRETSTDKATKTPSSKKTKESQGGRSSGEREERVESRDEIRLKKEVVSNLNSLHMFYNTSQELKSLIKLQLNTNLDQHIGCIKPTQSFGDLTKFDKLTKFKSLKNYQQCGVHWLSVVHDVQYASAILADEMGLGKTAQVCVFLEYIYRIHNAPDSSNSSKASTNNVDSPNRSPSSESDSNHSISPISSSSNANSAASGDNSPRLMITIESTTTTNTEPATPTSARRPGVTVIIVPLSVLNNWFREFETWTNLSKKVVIFHGNYKERMEQLESILEKLYNNEIFIIIMTLGMFKDVKVFKHFEPFEYLIIDEAHSIKNPNTTMYRKLLYSLDFRHKLLLTGTPIQNTMDELCSLLQFAMPFVFESSRINDAIYGIVNDPEFVYSVYPDHQLLDYLLGRSALSEGGESGNREGGGETSQVATGGSDNTEEGSGSESRGSGLIKGEDGGEAVNSDSSVGEMKHELYSCINNIIERNVNKKEIDDQLKIIQKLTTPFILRRLKRNVMNELPTKNSVYVPCEMKGIQLEIYQKFLSLSSFDNTDRNNGTSEGGKESESGVNKKELSVKKDSENAPSNSEGSNSSSKGRSAPVKSDPKGLLVTKMENVVYKNLEKEVETIVDNLDELENVSTKGDKGSRSSSTEKITYRIFQLRRICNHPLLVRGLYYTEKQVEKIAKLVVRLQAEQQDRNREGQKDKSKPRDREQELEKMNQYMSSLSDFEIYNIYLSTKAGAVGAATDDANSDRGTEGDRMVIGKVDRTVGAGNVVRESLGTDGSKLGMGGMSIGVNDEGTGALSGGGSRSEYSSGSESQGDRSSVSSTSQHSNSSSQSSNTARDPLMIEKDLFFESAKINKMFHLLGIILNRNENVLIFSQFTSYLDIIEKCFELRGIFNYLRLDGSLNVKQKEHILELFSSPTSSVAGNMDGYGAVATDTVGVVDSTSTNSDDTTTGGSNTHSGDPAVGSLDGGYRIMLISTKVGGIGLNLTRANNVILMDQSWNPHNDLQAEDRCHRIGQDKPVNIYKLFTRNSIEEHVIFMSTNKLYLNQLFNEN